MRTACFDHVREVVARVIVCLDADTAWVQDYCSILQPHEARYMRVTAKNGSCGDADRSADLIGRCQPHTAGGNPFKEIIVISLRCTVAEQNFFGDSRRRCKCTQPILVLVCNL